MRRMTSALFAFALLATGCNRDSAASGDTLREARFKTRSATTARFTLVVAITPRSAETSTAVNAKPEVVELKVSGLWNMRDDLVRSNLSYSTSAGGAGADYIVIKRVVYAGGTQAPTGKWRALGEAEGGLGDDGLGVLRPDPVLETLAGLAKNARKV